VAEKIGLQAIWQDAGFRQGVQQYTKSVDAATQTTDRGAQQITQSTQQVGSAWQTMGTIVGGVVSTYLVKQMAEAAFQLGMLGATAIRQRYKAFPYRTPGPGSRLRRTPGLRLPLRRRQP